MTDLASAQPQRVKAPISSPTPQTDFAKEEREGEEQDKQNIEEVRRHRKEAGEPATIIEPEPPSSGATGLKFLGVVKTKAPPLVFGSVLFSEDHTTRKSTQSAITCVIVNQNEASSNDNLIFANYSINDSGHVIDSVLLNNGRTLVMKNGVYNDLNSYAIYIFDKPTKRIFRFDALENSQLTVSPDRRYMTYVLGGGPNGPEAYHGGENPVMLHVWDAQLNHTTKVATNLRLQGSYSWKSDHELIYSQEKKRGAILVRNSYIWDATTGKSRLWLRNCQAPVLSPNGLYVVYAAPLDATKSFSSDNSTYVVQNLKTGKKTAVERAGLGKYDPNRQVTWSADSRLVFSLLNLWTQETVQGHRLFVYDRASRQVVTSSPLKPLQIGTLLASSSRGKRVFLLRQSILSPKLNAVGAWDYGFSVESVDTKTGQATTLWEKKHVLGLSDASIVFNKEFLRD